MRRSVGRLRALGARPQNRRRGRVLGLPCCARSRGVRLSCLCRSAGAHCTWKTLRRRLVRADDFRAQLVIRVATAPPRCVAVRSVSTKRRSRPHTAFVLSGGASLGALQVGMLRAVYESGIAADLLVGTSAGALNAAFVASRPQTVATANELARVWCGSQREDIFPVSMRTLVGGLCGRRDHLVPDRGLRRLVARHVEFQDISDAAIPLHVVAVDLDEGCEVLLSEGPAGGVIPQAAAVPGVFAPR